MGAIGARQHLGSARIRYEPWSPRGIPRSNATTSADTADGHENGDGNGAREGGEEEEIVESVGGADAHGRSARPRAALSPPVQNPGSDQAPAGHAGAGGQGRTRHQGRGAHDLPFARRPLFGADAEYRARRRHQPQDHQQRRPLAAQGNRAGARSAGRHGRDPAHRRRQPHQDRGQARLRIFAAVLGDGARPDAQIDARRRWSTRKARWSSARSATSTTRTSTKSSSPASDAYHEAKDFMRMLMPSHAKQREALQRHPAAVLALRRREPARRHVLAARCSCAPAATS